jgi:hypothetical protein
MPGKTDFIIRTVVRVAATRLASLRCPKTAAALDGSGSTARRGVSGLPNSRRSAIVLRGSSWAQNQSSRTPTKMKAESNSRTTIRVSAFRWVPPFAQGLVRDLRVRWILEEAGRPYEERLIGSADQGSAAYRALQPFGQVPAYEKDGLTLFESGAIVWHVAEQSGRSFRLTLTAGHGCERGCLPHSTP